MQIWMQKTQKNKSDTLAIICYLQVFKDLKADPVAPGVGDDAEAHVSRSVMEVTDYIYSIFGTFGTQKRV